MSTDTERLEEPADSSLLESWEEWYHVPVLGLVVVFMFWTRMRSYNKFTNADAVPKFGDVDAWYHWRMVEWTAENYPQTMPYEIFTRFPDGQYVGQFGTLYDQVVVTVAMLVGLGDPSTQTLYTVALVALPVVGALVAIPVFFAGRRLGGTLGGIVSAILLALAPGTFFFRSTTGQLDHHAAEVLMMAISLLATMVALRVAERERPIWELVIDADWRALRASIVYSVLAGIAVGLYIWVWPSAVVFVGILGTFYAVHLCLDYVRGVSPDHVAFVGAVSLSVTALFTAILIEVPGWNTTVFGYLQPTTALMVAAGCVFVAWFARQWNGFDVDRRLFPVAIGALIVAAFAAMAVVLPDVYNTLTSNLTSRLLPLNPGRGTLTIAEAQPPDEFPQYAFGQFGAAFFTMLVGLALLVLRPILGRKYRAEYTLVIVWTLFLISMTMTQRRFAYYLVLAVAVGNAVFVSDAIRLLSVERSVEAIRRIETYQVIALALVVLVLFAPLLPPLATAAVWENGAQVGPSDDALAWEEANHWLQGNSPEVGDWAGAGNDGQLEYNGVYERPEDGNFEYPEGSYGVMSWWDYGHLITVQGERIPHANPFQANARSASWYLTAQSEDHGEAILDGIAAGEPVVERSADELEAAVGDDDSNEELRYVMIDHKMAGGKFSAITQWTGPNYGTYRGQQQYDNVPSSISQQIGDRLPTPDENYDATMQSRLYHDDARGMEHYRLVHENDDYAVVTMMLDRRGITLDSFRLDDVQVTTPQGERSPTGSWDDNLTQSYIGQYTSAQRESQLEQFGEGFIWDPKIASSVKTFERVEGATLTGSVDAESVENATAVVQVPLETAPGREFLYEQRVAVDENGDFEVTVPYSTTNDLGPDDGYTNTSVTATEEYTVYVGTEPANANETFDTQFLAANVSVPESTVYDGEAIELSLEGSSSEETPENASDEESADADGSDGADGGTDDPETGNETQLSDNETQAAENET